MNWSLIFKINVMVLAFIGVIYVMRSMKSGPPMPPEPTPGAKTTMDWCDTRVIALEREGKPAVRQDKLKWYVGDQILEFIPVEKWFGRNCRVVIDRASPSEFDEAKAKPALIVKFIKGEPEALLASGNVYQWRRELFRSSELDQALADLDLLPRQQGIDKK